MFKGKIFLLALFFASCATSVASKTDVAYRYRSKETHTYKPSYNHSKYTVVVDAGHGGFDLGACANRIEEKKLCLKVARLLRDQLCQEGYNVVMTREHDEYVTLKKRVHMANEIKAQLFVSLHMNSSKNKDASGIEVYYYPEKNHKWRLERSKSIAQRTLYHMISASSAKSRGIKPGNFCVVRETKMPAILIECGFITNDQESKRLKNDEYLRSLSSCIARSINHYFIA
jgi:N-acetylmuramoyl-L-alanine amidase